MLTVRLRVKSASRASAIAERKRQRVTVPFNRLMTLTMAVLIPLVIILAKVAHLIGLVQLLATWPSILVLVAALCYCHWRKLSKLIEPCELVLWALALVGTL